MNNGKKGILTDIIKLLSTKYGEEYILPFIRIINVGFEELF